MSVSRKESLEGRVFNSWTVTKRFKVAANRSVLWLCVCVCGTQKYVRADGLKSEQSKSCGCSYKHDKATGREHKSWQHLKERCNNKKCKSYPNYGGKGISYEPKWETFAGFYQDMGDAPIGMTLDRKDNNKGYSKGNCRWASKETQSRNRKHTLGEDTVSVIRTLALYGVRQCDISRQLNVEKTVVQKVVAEKTWKGVGALPI